MTLNLMASSLRRAAMVGFGSLLLSGVPSILAQEPPPPQDQDAAAPSETMSPDQLDNLVAPVALYPDPLLGQLLVAATYPLEVVELQQFLQQNQGMPGEQLMDAVKQQNWDASVQALAAFPDVVARLNQDVRWTTDLGNAFLSQQGDVMNAVQRMRARAQQAGKLTSNQQETVVTQDQGGQPEIEIQPADPQVVYVPTYDPMYVWGPPAYGYYPQLYYPGGGFSYFPGVRVGLFFGDCCGWGGWGWGPNWRARTIIVNNSFIHRSGFRNFPGDHRGQTAWRHDPDHRLGLPYSNRSGVGQYRGGSTGGERGFRNTAPPVRSGESFHDSRGNVAAPANRGNFGNPGFENRNPGGSRSVFGGAQQGGGRPRTESDHGAASTGGRGGGAPRGGSAPAPAPRQSAPRSERSRGGERR